MIFENNRQSSLKFAGRMDQSIYLNLILSYSMRNLWLTVRVYLRSETMLDLLLM